MLSQRTIETLVGLFLLAVIISFITLAFKVSGLTTFFNQEGYTITAAFDDIGQLKTRGSVKIGGVTVGEVTDIAIDPASYKAIVTMRINTHTGDIPVDSSASILTAGLLGDNYIGLLPIQSVDEVNDLGPNHSAHYLKPGANIGIESTHKAVILEELISKFLPGQAAK